jgi:hypothetical protein
MQVGEIHLISQKLQSPPNPTACFVIFDLLKERKKKYINHNFLFNQLTNIQMLCQFYF